jgi:ribulose-bisphosphate carboxylase small chain
MDALRIRKQIEYIIRQEWSPVIEHVEPERVTDHYWYMWKLPMFGEREVAPILAEIATCREVYPDHYVRIVGYDNGRQTQGARIVVYQGDGGGAVGTC